jgi:septal ring factor EnvC (AmiA/AmiB activator)
VRINFKVTGLVLAAALAAAALTGSLAGAADPDLETKIDSAEQEATLITQRIDSQSARIAELEQQAADAAARERELEAELQATTARSTELNGQLVAAEEQLTEVRAQYKRAVGVLADHLVAIYKESEPDYLTVLLSSDGFDDLSTRSEYIEALNAADERIAERVSDLNDEVTGKYEEIAELKAGIDEQALKLEDAKSEIAAARAEDERRSAELESARSEARAALGDLQEKISGWELEVRKQAAAELGDSGGGGDAFLGGPYSIPTYIVMCESGGNYRALNPSSMAGGAYQIIPSTWQAYGGKGQYAHLASKAEQDRVAAIIWREDGPGAWSCA